MTDTDPAELRRIATVLAVDDPIARSYTGAVGFGCFWCRAEETVTVRLVSYRETASVLHEWDCAWYSSREALGLPVVVKGGQNFDVVSHDRAVPLVGAR